jgi:predicted enzyme related to lactoylglutathione lyase
MTNLQTTVAITGIDLSALIVRDPAAATAYYRDLLGIPTTAVDDEGRGAEFTLADGATIGVWNGGEGTPPGQVLFFAVDDARAAIDAVRSRGVTISDAMEGQVCVMGWGSDPDGNGFCLHQRKNRDQDAPPPTPGTQDADVVGLDAAGIVTADVPRAMTFYREVLGMVPTVLYPEDKGGEFTLADGATFTIYGSGGESFPPAGVGLLAVRDIDAAVARLRSRGGTISDPMQTPVCRMAFGTDADGFMVCLHRRTVTD